MQTLTQKTYTKLINDISNDDVPVLMASALIKIDRHIHSLGQTVPASTVNLANLFRLFMKQFNTIRVLAERTSYVEYPQCTYQDIKSINVLIRSAHESLLTFGYLSSDSVFKAEDEIHFKYLCHRHGGAVDQERIITLRERNFETNFFRQQYKAAQSERVTTWANLCSHPIFASLSNNIREKVRNGGWRIESAKTLGWNALAKYTALPEHWAKSQYHVLSIYAHAGYLGTQLECTHNKDVPGMLMHLYVVAAYFIALFDERIAANDIQFIDQEVAIVLEMIGLSREQDLVFGESNLWSAL